jgi:hypothetical protein
MYQTRAAEAVQGTEPAKHPQTPQKGSGLIFLQISPNFTQKSKFWPEMTDENVPNMVQPKKGQGNSKTIEQTYTKLTQLSHILLRPDTYGKSSQSGDATFHNPYACI